MQSFGDCDAGLDLPSIDEARPIEQGGPYARIGFNYQDHITCSLFIDMLAEPEIVKVHCESHDDAVVVRRTVDVVVAEYVQVKSNDKTWTLSDICAVKNGSGTSLYETSLLRDCHREVSRFRIVTLRPVSNELRFLTFPIGAPGRETTSDAFQQVQVHLNGKFPEVKSKKGNDCLFWMSNCHWQPQDSEQGINAKNLVRLQKLAIQEGRPLLLDQAQIVLDDLLGFAKAAAAALWEPDKHKKIILRSVLYDWWTTRVQDIVDGASVRSGGKLRTKMEEAGLPEEMILLAQDMRRDYVRNVRDSRYMEPTDMERLQSCIKSEVMSLRSKLVSGQLDLDGAAFHDKCLDAIDAMAEDHVGPEAIAFSKGCLYDIADRCLLRFTRTAS